MGAPITRAPIVTRKDETIMGKMPKEPFVGAHLKPPMILLQPHFQKEGKTFRKIKMKIRKRKRREESAKATSIHLTNRSFRMALSIIETYKSFLFQDFLPVS